jgi:hypothetical protein
MSPFDRHNVLSVNFTLSPFGGSNIVSCYMFIYAVPDDQTGHNNNGCMSFDNSDMEQGTLC